MKSYRTLDMEGPFSLTSIGIDSQITRTAAGNYALGNKNAKGIFIVKYVGRSDSDVNARLKQHLDSGHEMFKYSYATSPKAAFEKECKNFHDFGENGKLENEIHPDRPNDSRWKCPYCE